MMTTRRFLRLPVIACACLAATSAQAQDDVDETSAEQEAMEPALSGEALDEAAADTLDLRRTEITGNQELPKVLYIVPWQKADPGNLLGRPVNTLLDEVLAPIDREEFIRQVDYYSDLNGGDLNEPQDE